MGYGEQYHYCPLQHPEHKALVYCATTQGVVDMREFLMFKSIRATYILGNSSGKMDDKTRRSNLEAWESADLNNEERYSVMRPSP